MARLKVRRNPTGTRVPSELIGHEGPQPGAGDTEAYAAWLATRHARFAREVGGPADPRHGLMGLGQ